MEFIRPIAEIWEQDTNSPLEGIWKHIARCTRVCYQSTPKNNGETDEEFVKRVILRTNSSTGELNFDKIHGAMLEHGTVYLKLEITPKNCFSKFEYPSCKFTAPYNWSDVVGSISAKYNRNEYSKVVYGKYDKGCRTNCITTNLRVIIENNWLEDLQFICAPTEHHAKRVTVSFTTNIGVSREFNRHRVDSPAEESTRYCNYNKRNKGQLNIGLPAWLLDDEHLPYLESHQFDTLTSYCEEYLNDNNDINPECWCDMDFYLFSLTVAEYCYNMLIKKGWKPQQAREVLPLATKSQLIHTAFVDDWKHFFALRADGVSGPPHPNAELLAKPLKEEFIKLGYI